MKIQRTAKQALFMDATQDEVLFGGAAGGGKSYAQLIDAFLYACKYAGSKQLILRRTFPELNMSLIRVSQDVFPQEVCTYSATNHVWTFRNGSLVDFGYCERETDVIRYQSAEYDCIRFDELTHFSEYVYTYLLSRLRGANDFPKQMKSSTNPGGVGHAWVKARFVDPAPPLTEIKTEQGTTRIFIPARVQENSFLMDKDPQYLRRLEALPENERRALLLGEWDVFEGRFFTEWDSRIHTLPPFPIPPEWRRVFVMDYGLDMLAGYWIALDTIGYAYVYREVYESGLIISEAADRIKSMNNGDRIEDWCAPPDLWNRRQETGKSVADWFGENGIYLRKVNNGREQGWLDLREWLKVFTGEDGRPTARLRVFNTCRNLIRVMPSVIYDPKNPNDISNEPHELTHAPDALRYFAASRQLPAVIKKEPDPEVLTIDRQIINLFNF